MSCLNYAKQMMIKMSAFLCALSILFVSFSFHVSAQIGYAYSMFTNANANTAPLWFTQTQLQTYAYYWDSLGRHSYYNSHCTYSYVSSTNRINSEFVTFVGHGSSEVVQVHENPLVSVTKYSNNSSVGDVGLLSYTLSDVKLMVFGGCETAHSDPNLNICQVAVNRGADTVLGFTGIVARQDVVPYITKFAQRAAAGYTMAQCLTYANSFTYTNNNIKCGKLYGNTSQTLSAITPVNNGMGDDTEFIIDSIFLSYGSNNFDALYREINKQLPDVNLQNYQVEYTLTNENRTDFVLDFIEYIGNVPTNNTITVVFENNTAVLARDNRFAPITSVPVLDVNSIIESDSFISKCYEMNRAITDSLDENESILCQNGSVYYNCESGEYRYKVFTTTQIGSCFSAYTTEIPL